MALKERTEKERNEIEVLMATYLFYACVLHFGQHKIRRVALLYTVAAPSTSSFRARQLPILVREDENSGVGGEATAYRRMFCPIVRGCREKEWISIDSDLGKVKSKRWRCVLRLSR